MTPDYSHRLVASGHAEPSMSAARLAAEAFFAPTPPSAAVETGAPEVVVKKLRVPAGTADGTSTGVEAVGAAAEASEDARAPRVFRMESSKTLETATEEGAAENAAQPQWQLELSSVEEVDPTPPSIKRAPRLRRKRKQLHGEVKVIRPQAPAEEAAPIELETALVASAQVESPKPSEQKVLLEPRSAKSNKAAERPNASAVKTGEPESVEASMSDVPAPPVRSKQRSSGRPNGSTPVGAEPVRQLKAPQQTYEYDWPRYPLMLARLRGLAAEAELARQREAVQAIVWIKEAVVTYGLSAQDLGLR